jgi:hypothetical protein
VGGEGQSLRRAEVVEAEGEVHSRGEGEEVEEVGEEVGQIHRLEEVEGGAVAQERPMRSGGARE